MPNGSEFQTAGAATRKQREVKTRGTDNRLMFAERRERVLSDSPRVSCRLQIHAPSRPLPRRGRGCQTLWGICSTAWVSSKARRSINFAQPSDVGTPGRSASGPNNRIVVKVKCLVLLPYVDVVLRRLRLAGPISVVIREEKGEGRS